MPFMRESSLALFISSIIYSRQMGACFLLNAAVKFSKGFTTGFSGIFPSRLIFKIELLFTSTFLEAPATIAARIIIERKNIRRRLMKNPRMVARRDFKNDIISGLFIFEND